MYVYQIDNRLFYSLSLLNESDPWHNTRSIISASCKMFYLHMSNLKVATATLQPFTCTAIVRKRRCTLMMGQIHLHVLWIVFSKN